jgi:hypothetical protein
LVGVEAFTKAQIMGDIGFQYQSMEANSTYRCGYGVRILALKKNVGLFESSSYMNYLSRHEKRQYFLKPFLEYRRSLFANNPNLQFLI